jgi:N-methylhydantoinase A
VVLGYIDPDNFLGGRIKLDRKAATAAIAVQAKQLGLSLMETAAGIARIAEFKMADIIRKTTVQKGFDPRDFVLYAFGGAGPVHASVFGAELGVKKVVIPLRHIASTWCALGAASADILHVYEQVDIQVSPFDVARVNRVVADLAGQAEARMAKDGVAKNRRKYAFSIDMRHKGQINEVEVLLPEGRLSERMLESLRERFYLRYEQLYGHGSSYRNARLELVTMRLRASAATPRPQLARAKTLSATIPARAKRPARDIYWAELKRSRKTPVFDGALLKPGNRVAGPAIVETTDTTVVIHPRRTLKVDAFGNFEILFAA